MKTYQAYSVNPNPSHEVVIDEKNPGAADEVAQEFFVMYPTKSLCVVHCNQDMTLAAKLYHRRLFEGMDEMSKKSPIELVNEDNHRFWKGGIKVKDWHGCVGTLVAPTWNGWAWIMYEGNQSPTTVNADSLKRVCP